MDQATLIIVLVVIGVLVVGLLTLFYFVPLGLWIAALSSGVRVSIPTLIGMRLRRVNPNDVIRPLITAYKADLDLNLNFMEAHNLAGGDVERVVAALVSADRARIPLTWERATAIDLAGRDVLQAVVVHVEDRHWHRR